MINIPEEFKPIYNEPSEFRCWCNEMWMQHKDEIFIWEQRLPEYDSTYYFRKHRWMLKKMFQQQKIEEFLEENEKKISKEVKRGFKKGNL
tara:strand:- start:31 stop:300 length:270 start_codon:yes stop_codon:yes gene_type:complete